MLTKGKENLEWVVEIWKGPDEYHLWPLEQLQQGTSACYTKSHLESFQQSAASYDLKELVTEWISYRAKTDLKGLRDRL